MDEASAITAAEAQVDFLGEIIASYRSDGFEKGYKRASADLLACLVYNSEQFLREHAASQEPADLRKVLYAFVDRLERQLDRNAQSRGYVEGGLGI